MVEQVEDLKANLEAYSFRELGSFVDVKVPLPELGSAQAVAAAGPDGAGGGSGKNRGMIDDGGTTGVTELVDRFYPRAIRPFINPVLARRIGEGTQQRGPRTPRQNCRHRPDLPTLSQATEGMRSRNIVNDTGIEVQPDIGVARAQVAAGIVRILLDRNCRSTATIHGIGVKAVRPGEINRGIQTMPIPLAVSCLQGVVAGVAIVGQFGDVTEVVHAL